MVEKLEKACSWSHSSKKDVRNRSRRILKIPQRTQERTNPIDAIILEYKVIINYFLSLNSNYQNCFTCLWIEGELKKPCKNYISSSSQQPLYH